MPGNAFRSCLIFVLLAACGDEQAGPDALVPVEIVSPFLGITNVRLLKIDNVALFAFRNKSEFTELNIGSPDAFYDGKKSLYISLPGSGVLELSSSEVINEIVGYLPFAVTMGPDWESRWHYPNYLGREEELWPPGTRRLQIAPYYTFYVYQGRLVGVQIADGRDWSPSIGREPGSLFELPLSGSDAQQVFGPMDKVYETFRM